MMIIASFEFKLPEDFLDKITKLGDQTDAIISRVLDAGGEVALQAVRSKLNDSIGRGNKTNSRSTGELVAALGVSPARIDRNGNANVKIGFKEPRSGGKSNAMIANVLEYGKHGQPPRPFLKPAKAASRASVITAMEQKLDEELSNL